MFLKISLAAAYFTPAVSRLRHIMSIDRPSKFEVDCHVHLFVILILSLESFQQLCCPALRR